MNDPDAGVRIRVGNVGQELAYTFAEQGNAGLMREALSKPHIGVWFSKSF